MENSLGTSARRRTPKVLERQELPSVKPSQFLVPHFGRSFAFTSDADMDVPEGAYAYASGVGLSRASDCYCYGKKEKV